jgi:hypothetical protein
VELKAFLKNEFVADGRDRFMRAKREGLAESIEEKYAKELAGAIPVEKIKIRERMAQEILRRKKTLNHKPSAGTLW